MPRLVGYRDGSDARIAAINEDGSFTVEVSYTMMPTVFPRVITLPKLDADQDMPRDFPTATVVRWK